MRYLLFFTALFIMGCSTLQNTSINQKPYNPQAKFFPVEVQKIEFYMGMSKDSIPLKYLNRLQDNEGDYRERYIIPNFSQRIDTLVYYLDIDDDKPLYEILLKINKNFNADSIAHELYGPPNYMGKEWRFSQEKTGANFLMAAWTYKNKLIIAGAVPKTRWGEDGFYDPQ